MRWPGCGGNLRRHLQRRHEARLIGYALAGNAEGGAMVGRGADEGQAERDIDGIVEAERLGRNQRLIVIHAHRHVILLAGGIVEHGVGGQGAEGIDPVLPQPHGRRVNDITILSAECAIFTRMRVEAGNRQTRRLDAEFLPEIGIDDPAGRDDQLFGESGRHVFHGDMDRHRDDTDLGAGNHHHRDDVLAGLAQGKIGEKLRMAGEAETRVV